MKVYKVVYPFLTATPNSLVKKFYKNIAEAKKEALDEYIAEEESEDDFTDEDNLPPIHYSKQSAKVYEVEVQLKRSVIAAIMNGETPTPATTETLVHEFRYRRGKIVVTNAKAATEPENVG
jgi:hypothetical protein